LNIKINLLFFDKSHLKIIMHYGFISQFVNNHRLIKQNNLSHECYQLTQLPINVLQE